MLRLVLALPVVAAAADFVPVLQAHDSLLARTDRPPTDACSVADGIINICALYVDDDTPDDEKATCYCCDDTKDLEPAYKTCEEYLSADLTMYAGYSSAYAAVATLQAFCDSASATGFSCAAAATSTAGEPTSLPAYLPSTSISGPPACTSLGSMVAKCQIKDIDNVANCVCYSDGVYDPRFDAYAAECNDWYKTADELDGFHQISTFCEAWASSVGSYTPATGSATTDAFSTAPSTALASSTSTAAATLATTPKTTAASSTATSTATSTAASTQSTSQAAATAGAALNRAAGSGFVAWLAVVLPAAML